MPPVRETKLAAARTGRVTPTAKTTAPPRKAMGAFEEQRLAAAMKAANPTMPDWMVRAAVISRSEELRTRQQLQQDKVTGADAGHNDIYDAERHGRWMYRLTKEVSAFAGSAIGALKEVWGMLKGAGGAETAMDLHNNEVGRQAALKGGPIPRRDQTPELVFLDAGKPRSNADRLKWIARGKATAAAVKGAAVAKRPLALSGSVWWHANQAKFPNSRDLNDLASPFREQAVSFHDALVAAGATVSVSSTRRDVRRAYLMHYCWKVANGSIKAEDVPAHPGVDIVWDHGDPVKSKAAAAEMKALFGMKYIAALNSIHIEGGAVDMTIRWTGTIQVKDGSGVSHAVGAPRSGSANTLLHEIGATYGVKKLVKDEPHWSATGH